MERSVVLNRLYVEDWEGGRQGAFVSVEEVLLLVVLSIVYLYVSVYMCRLWGFGGGESCSLA